ncbi:hypothetical protein JHK86_025425 [Glycine max]|nr:hypothetical protein JHK86_025425 [Glycine max]
MVVLMVTPPRQSGLWSWSSSSFLWSVELHAICFALKLTWQLGYRDIICESDSLSAINMISKGMCHRDFVC